MKHIRLLIAVEASNLGSPVTLTFTRAFLADDFKGIRTRVPRDIGPTKAANVCNDATPAIAHPQEADNMKSDLSDPLGSVGRPTIQPKRYFLLVSPTLRALRGEDSTSDSESSESEPEVVTCVPKRLSSAELPIVTANHDKLKCDSSKQGSQKVRNFGDDVSDLHEQLRRLGLPTSFGTTNKPDFYSRDYESEQQWVDTPDETLLQLAESYIGSIRFKHEVRRCRRRTASITTNHHVDRSQDSLSHYVSSEDLFAYHKGVFANLCYLLELACSFDQHECPNLNIHNLNLPRAWRSPDFNLEAFLYSCKKYWRYTAPCSRTLSSDGQARRAQNTPDLSNLESDPVLAKYWAQRFRLFSRFNDGIQIDRDGFFSATPEAIACHQALRAKQSLSCTTTPTNTLTVIDACSGTGANSIQFALLGFRVVAVEVDPSRVAMAAHNAEIYGVRSQIEFVCADFFQWARQELLRHSCNSTRPYAVAFMSPPWGGPAYLNSDVFDLNCIHFDSDASDPGARTFWFAVQLASQLTGGNLILFLPRNTNMAQLLRLSECVRSACLWSTASQWPLEVEVNVLNAKFKSLSIYSGALCNRTAMHTRSLSQRAHIELFSPSNSDEDECFDSTHSDSDDFDDSDNLVWSHEDDDDDADSSCGYVTASEF